MISCVACGGKEVGELLVGGMNPAASCFSGKRAAREELPGVRTSFRGGESGSICWHLNSLK